MSAAAGVKPVAPPQAGHGRRQSYGSKRKTGVDWLGVVPEHWGQKRLKHAVCLVNDKVESAGNDTRYVGLEHVESWTGRLLDSPNGTDEGTESVANSFQAEDVLFGKLRPYLAKVLHAPTAGVCSSELLVLRARDLLPRFLFYYLLNRGFVEVVDGSTFGSKMPRADWQFIGNQPALIPPLAEQRAIAAFLDRETANIDSLVAKKRRLVELLREKRTALISRAVTKGLNPAAPMKPSGTDWLGDVPKHWETKRLKFVVSEPLKYGANEAAELDERTLPRYIRITDVDEDGRLRDETFKSIPEDVARPYLLRDGDVLLARSGATVGKSFYYDPSWGRAAYAGYLIRARVNPTRTLPRFVSYFMTSSNYWQWLNSSFIQATIQNVSAEKYANLMVPMPPLAEQRKIVAHMDEKSNQLSGLIAGTETVVGYLKEYRSALISAAVTGKIDVRYERGR